MLEAIQQLNYDVAQLIGVTLFDPQHFISLIIRFVINLIVVSVIARYFYFPRSHRRDYMFIFILMAMSIFLLVNLMEGDSMNIGAAMGLFAIFGIMRFRTEAVPIREMTYLFMLIALSVVNALAHWFFESTKVMSEECSRIILYDNVNLVAPEKREELKADLEKRTGLKIKRIEIGLLDYLKDSALIRIFYDNPEEVGNSIARFGRMPKEI